MNIADNVRSLWLGARTIFAGSHKTTVVICPTAELPAQVGLDPVDRLESCSRWRELQGCRQACLPQVKFSTEELEDFTNRYEGKKCACGEALTADDWYKSRLVLLDPKAATGDTAPSCLVHSMKTSFRPA
jgi:hypothetical protein